MLRPRVIGHDVGRPAVRRVPLVSTPGPGLYGPAAREEVVYRVGYYDVVVGGHQERYDYRRQASPYTT